MHSTAEARSSYEAAVGLLRLGRLEEARVACEQALQGRPADFSLLHLSGIIALQSGRPAIADEYLGRALEIRSANAEALGHRGDALLDLGRHAEAVDCYDRAIALRPDHTAALNNRGLALMWLGRHRAAVECFDRTIAIDPRDAEAYAFRGHALRASTHYAAAIESYDAALALKADHAEAWNGRGSALAALPNHEPALASFDHAIAVRPDFAEAHLNRANTLKALGRVEEAIRGYARAIELRPDFAEAFYRLGDAQRAAGRLQEALVNYDRAGSLKPDMTLLPGMRCDVRLRLCDWRTLEADAADLEARVQQGEPACPPLLMLALTDSPSLQRKAAQVFVQSEYPPASSGIAPPQRHGGERFKIGYFSPDFREHAVAYLTAELFEMHDRTAFEVTAFSLTPPGGRGGGDPGGDDDAMTRRLKGAFEHFVDVGDRSDEDIARLARDMELDIAVDLCGFTEGCRPGVFARRAAPLQVSYLGYPGTLGASYIDYLVADRTLVPPAVRPYYDEKIIHLPVYQSNDSTRRIAPISRTALGIPESAFVYCCFNNPWKITPATFSSWMRILAQVPNAVLLLYAPQSVVADNLRREAAARGIDPARLIFGGLLPRPQYLGRYAAADLFLDTAPYTAGTTASDALWAGLPLLTCAGQSFAGRMAASLLAAVGIPDLITSTPEGYEALAVELARNSYRLARIRQRLSAARLDSPLFDTPRFTRSLETAFRRIHARRLAGQNPEDIAIHS